jgi:hypothetical protein
MKPSFLSLALVLGLVGGGSTLGVSAARAESPYERDQRQMLEQYQREHGLSPQVQQAQRWQQEWRQQHPNEPMPNFGELEKLHRQEIIANMNQGFAKMRQARQAKLQHDYLMSRQHQQQILAAQHITWNAQQWKEWDRQYDLEQQQRANDYLKAAALSGQMAREEAARDESERIRRGGN